MLNKNENTKALLNEIIKGIEEMKGQDINKIDLREIENSPCEYFVICSGNSNTQVSSIVNSVRKSVSKILKEKPLHIASRCGRCIFCSVLQDFISKFL